MSQSPLPQQSLLDRGIDRAKNKLRRGVRFGTAVYQAADEVGLEPRLLYAEMDRRRKLKGNKLQRNKDAREQYRSRNDRRAA